ncbi:MAG: ABC transporter substrate-binding protein [Desulfobacteraceae bacterium]|nr:ABC transporter substrate-binding protein [Desulfobacteraceae bacterium]
MRKLISLFVCCPMILLLTLPLGAGEIIKIGGVGPLSAPGSFESGKEMKMAMEQAVEEINGTGGVLGKKVVLAFEDTQGLPEKGTAAMERLVEKQKAVAVVGEFHSSVAKAEIEVANRLKIPLIIAEAWADVITAKQYRYVFRIAPANSLFYSKIADWIQAAGFKNVVMITENSDYGIGVERVIREALKTAGIKITSITAERTIQDFTPQLLRFKLAKPRPDLLFGIFTGAGELLMVKQAHEIGFAPTKETAMFAVGTDALHKEFWEITGPSGKYILTKTGYYPGIKFTEKTDPFIKRFKTKFNREPTFAAMEAYEAVYLVADAIQRAGSTDADAIVSALETTRYTGLRGVISFSMDREPAYMYHQWPGTPSFVIQYTEVDQPYTDALLLWPKEYSDGSLIKP